MMYLHGKEVRHDDESEMEAFAWLVICSLSIRVIIGHLFFRGDSFLPVLNRPLSSVHSWILFTILTFINTVFFIYILDMERNVMDTIKYSIIPPFISGVLFYSQTYRYQIFIISILLLVFVIVPTIRYILKKNMAKRKKKKLKKLKVFRRLYREAYRYSANLAFSVSVIFVIAFIFVPSFDGRRVYLPSVNAASYEVEDDSIYALLDENKEVLMTLQNDKWKEASVEERMNALQVLLNCEISYFKIQPLKIYMKTMSKYKAGYYDVELKEAYICPEDVKADTSEEAVETVIHEGRHHYQHQMIDYADQNDLDLSLPVYSDIREWKKNCENYYDKDGEMTVNEYYHYRTQPLESDAFQYGSDMSILILSYINSWN